MRAIELLQEKFSRNKPVVCVDVQPAYMEHMPGAYPYNVARFLTRQAGPILMYVNADETGMTEDNIEHEIFPFWQETFEGIGGDFYEDGLPKMEFFDKGYGYLRSWMDNAVSIRTIIRVLRYMANNRMSDSRDIDQSILEKLVGDEWKDWMADDPLSIGWVAMDQLKRYNNCYLIGG